MVKVMVDHLAGGGDGARDGGAEASVRDAGSPNGSNQPLGAEAPFLFTSLRKRGENDYALGTCP